MPTRPVTPCFVPLCPNRAVYRGRCAVHMRRAEHMRGTAAERGYDAAWRTVRAAVLAEQPTCVVCGALAEVVHHVDGDSRDNDRRNLLALCRDCHERAHGRGRGR